MMFIIYPSKNETYSKLKSVRCFFPIPMNESFFPLFSPLKPNQFWPRFVWCPVHILFGQKLKVPEYVAGGVNTDGLEAQFIEL